jgi:ribulokinase 2
MFLTKIAPCIRSSSTPRGKALRQKNYATGGLIMKRYSIGLDYGTLSVRALLIDFTTGEELACCEYEYPHAVMDDALPCGKKLPPDWAL